jgi:Flp pilus assembly pilin Flp
MIAQIKLGWSDEQGTTVVEYALLLAVLIIAGIGIWTTFGRQVQVAVASSTNALSNAL